MVIFAETLRIQGLFILNEREEKYVLAEKKMRKVMVSHKILCSTFSRNTNPFTGITCSGTGYATQGCEISRCLLVMVWQLIIITEQK